MPVSATNARSRGLVIAPEYQYKTMTSLTTLTEILLGLAGLYLGIGLVFAIPFVLAGVQRIDPHARHGSWGFRLLIVPGTMALWPLLLCRWVKGASVPPEEPNAHRQPARPGVAKTSLQP